MPIVDQDAAPAGLRLKTTVVASPAVDALSATVPESGEPGLLSETVGAVESMLTVIDGLVNVLPARSVTTMRRSWATLGSEVTSHVAENGELESLAMSPKPPPPDTRACQVTDATPEPPSEPVAASGTAEPPTVAPPPGAVSRPLGSVLSTRVVAMPLVPELPPASTAIARSS